MVRTVVPERNAKQVSRAGECSGTAAGASPRPTVRKWGGDIRGSDRCLAEKENTIQRSKRLNRNKPPLVLPKSWENQRGSLYYKADRKQKERSLRISLLVREAGVEPARPCEHRHLKPASLPIPPLAQAADVLSFRTGCILPRRRSDVNRKNENKMERGGETPWNFSETPRAKGANFD